MIKNYSVLLMIFQINFFQLYCQKVEIEFEYQLEKKYDCEIVVSRQLDDGGFILGAILYKKLSLNPLIKVNYEDYLIIRIDKKGEEVWQRIYGDKYFDRLSDIVVLQNNNFIIGGSSDSYKLGNKTSPNYGLKDYWLIKLNSEGEEVWQRTFGGKRNDIFSEMGVLTNNSIVIGGTSISAYNGSKLTGRYGYSYDFWVINIDSDGNDLWQKNYGGYSLDSLSTLDITHDDHIILGGLSFSNADGSKTEFSKGLCDYWVVKINKNGDFVWDTTIGGYSVDAVMHTIITKDNNILLQGYSNTYTKEIIDVGPKYNNQDKFLVKLDLESGQVLWEKYLPNRFNFFIENHQGNLVSLNNFSLENDNNDIFYDKVFPTYISIFDSNVNFKKEIFIDNFGYKNYDKLIQTKDKSYLLTGVEFVNGDDINQEYKKTLNVVKLFHEVDLENLQNNINVFPNAFTNIINIDYDKDILVKMFSPNGKKIIETNSKNFRVENLAVSNYLLHIYNIKGQLISINKLLKK